MAKNMIGLAVKQKPASPATDGLGRPRRVHRSPLIVHGGRRTAGGRRRRLKKGLVLVAVLWLMVILTFLALSFSRMTRMELHRVKNLANEFKARELAKSAILRAIAELEEDADLSTYDALSETWHNSPEAFYRIPLGEGEYYIFSGALEPNEEVIFGLQDESAKLNVNFATLQMLLALPGMDEEIAQALLDFQDSDDTEHPGGAESGYYQSLEPSYSAKNEPFDTLDELLLVRGIDQSVLYGEDTNQNGRLDANEDDGDETWPPDNADGVLDPGLANYLTVYGIRLGERLGPAVRLLQYSVVNVNTASREVLEAIGVDSQAVDEILDYRANAQGILDNRTWLREILGPGEYERLSPRLGTTSNIFSFQVLGVLPKSRTFKRIKVVVDRSELPAQIIYWRDMTALGPAFPLEEEE